MKLFSDVALENILNNSVCVKTDIGIRNVKDYRDMEISNIVFVHTVSFDDEELITIPQGVHCRYSPINVNFR